MKFTTLLSRYLRLSRTHLERLCQQSTVPGLNYFVDPSISIYQRSVFGLLMLCATGFTIVNMVSAYYYSQDHYVITNIETLQFPLWNLTYPAVHICNLNRISLKNLNKVMDKWIFPNNMTRKEAMQEMRTLPVLAFKMKLTNNYSTIRRILSMNNVSLSVLMNQLSDSCSDYLKTCRWWKKDYRCDQLFSKTVSVDGYCCSFNSFMYHSRQENAFRKARIATSCSYSDNLIVTMETNKSDYFSSLSSSFGFAVYLKNPYLYPDSSEIGKLSPFNMVILISFLAKKVFSTDEVKDIPEKYRDCSSSGRPLAAFQTYSYHNCIVECRINLTVRLCKCVPLIFPFTSDNQRRCGIEDMPCLHQYSDILQAINHGISAENSAGQTEFQQKNLLDVDHVKKRPCNCLPDCSRTLYEADAVYSPLVQRKGFRENRTYHQLYVYAQDVISTRIRRDTFYTWYVLLGTYGGLLGFFLGLSIICFSEIFYFAILQPIVVFLKTKFLSCDGINSNPSDSSTALPVMFVASVENESRSIKQQTSVERYNKRLVRAMKHSKTKKVFPKSFNQEWVY